MNPFVILAYGWLLAHPPGPPAPTVPPAPAAGRIAFHDPETGALVQPTGSQLEELARQLAAGRSAEAAPRFETLPDGTVIARTGSRFRVYEWSRTAAPREEKP